MEELQMRHRKEQRELQSRITQKKKNATKKTRKGVNDECDVLERDLKERQAAELKALETDSFTEDVNDLSVEGKNEGTPEELALEEPIATTTRDQQNANGSEVTTEQTRSKKPNRQKARLARRAAEQEGLAAAAEVEASKLPDKREQETTAMQAHMEKLGLREISIRPDGHCLYSAVATGIPESTVKDSGPYSIPYQNVRFTTSNFISMHPDDFMPFLEEPLQSYVSKIKDTAEWGGQLELQAIARAYTVDINVLQADGRIEKFESGATPTADPVWLAYYRHSFGLGEHYNALEKAS